MDPFLASVLAGLIPSLLLAALAWHTNRVQKDRDQIDTNRCERISRLERIIDEHEDKGRALELEMARVQTLVGQQQATTSELKDELTDIRDNMVRKGDFADAMTALRDHISDALRLTPHNKRR